MLTLPGIESFVRSAEAGSFSAAARRLGLTSAAVSKNVAKLEEELGVRLFHRTTRKLTPTEAGAQFAREVGAGLSAIHGAVAGITGATSGPAGVLKVSMAPGFGHRFLLPALNEFLLAHPAVTGEWQFEMRNVDLVGEGFDAAIGGGFALAPGLVARELAKIHIIAVATPGFLAGKTLTTPEQLAAVDGVVMRAGSSHRLAQFTLRDRAGKQRPAEQKPRVVVSDLDAALICARQGLGIALLPVGVVLDDLESGALARVLPSWYAEFGAISIYYASARHLPAKTRAFVDHMLAFAKRERFAEKFLASAVRGGPR